MRTLTLLLALLAGAVAQAGEPITLRGEFQQGGMVIGQAPPDSAVQLGDQSLRISDQGHFVFGFDRDHGPDAVLQARLPDQSVWTRKLAVTPREYVIQRIDGLPSKQVTPDPAALKRIREEGAAAAAARRRDDNRQDFLAAFIWPSRGPISGVYGSQRILNGEPRRPHYGVDVAAPVGTSVVAPAAGIVTLVNPDMYFSGGTLILDHGHGISSSFLHLSQIDVKPGQRVAQGDKIAEIGATGRVTGPHLDWRMNWFGERIDPQLLVGEMPADD